MSSNPENVKRRIRSTDQKSADKGTPAKEETPAKEPKILTVVIGKPPENRPDAVHNIVGDRLYVPKQNGGFWKMMSRKTVSDHQNACDHMPVVLEKFEKDLKENTDEKNNTKNSVTTKKTELENKTQELELLSQDVEPMKKQVNLIKTKIEKHDEDGPFVKNIVAELSESDRTDMIVAYNEARNAMLQTLRESQQELKTQTENIATLKREIGSLEGEIPRLNKKMKALELKHKQLLVFSARIVATMHALAHTSVNLLCSSMGMDVNALEGAAQGVQPAIGPP